MKGDEELPDHLSEGGGNALRGQPSLVITVLGSCLSVTMHDRADRASAGICHGLLPACEDRTVCPTGCREGFRYVDCSIRQMLRLFEKAGSPRRRRSK